MSRDLTYFVSDLHLGASYIPNNREHELLVVSWLKEISPNCRELYLVGDILDYWFEYRNVVPRGFTRFFGQLASMADEGIKITWLIGNHDIWIFDYLPAELGIEVVDGAILRSIDGKNFYITHGDAIGSLKPGFRFIRSFFRNPICQKLYSGIHPRWTIPFAHAWSSSSRKGYKQEYNSLLPDDKDPYLMWAKDYIAQHPYLDFIILGHRHIMADKIIGEHCHLIVLGDWIRNFSFAVYDGKDVILKKYH